MSSQIQRSSFVSQVSQSMSGGEIEVLNDEELIEHVNHIKRQLRILKLENEILEKTIMRLEPALMNGVYQALEYATRMSVAAILPSGSIIKSQTSKFGFVDSITSRPVLSSPSRASTRRGESTGRIGGAVVFGSGPRINVLEMLELISTETVIQGKNLEKFKKRAAKQQAYLKAQLEEIEIRVNDTEKASKLFKQDVLIDGWDKIAQRIPAETWTRFMTEWVKTTDRQIGKLRLRTSTLNTQYSRFKTQIKVKAELSESLRPVDFQKLKIDNSECEKVIENKIKQLEQLKKLTGDANLTLAVHKKAMMLQNDYLTKVIKTKKIKEQETEEIDKEYERIQNEADNLALKLEEIKKLRKKYEAPDVMEYVTIKWEITNLTHAIKMLENRAHIHRITLSSLNKKLQMLQNEM